MKLTPLSWVSSLVRRDPPAAARVSRPIARPIAPRTGAAARSPEPEATALSSVGQAWLDGLPSRLRPTCTAAAYPRIVNRLALCWRDPELVAKVFADLMVDRRGGRRGFPPAVAAELLALRDAQALEPVASRATRAWDLRTVATSDRDSRFDEDAIATRF